MNIDVIPLNDVTKHFHTFLVYYVNIFRYLSFLTERRERLETIKYCACSRLHNEGDEQSTVIGPLMF